MQLRFGGKAQEMMREKQAAGSAGNKGKKREAKDFDKLYQDAMYEGWSRDACEPDAKGKLPEAVVWRGIPAPAFRNACVDACRLVGFKMTHAKLGVFIVADGNDVLDGTPLVKITKGEPKHCEHPVRNASGVADIRVRAMWTEWEAMLRVRFDAEMFSSVDVMNLLARVGMQVGIGEGRPNSKESCGMGWGTFEIVND